jgi:amino acid transporter
MTNLAPAALKRRLNLPLLVLYGTGITVGAGIYVLIGAVAGHAGAHAPWSFVLAAVVMALTVASYAEMCTRYPVSAGEAAYVKAAFGSRWLSTATGLVTIFLGIISSSAVGLGAAGYIQQFLDWPTAAIVTVVVLALGLLAAWGILESVLVASLFTLIEVGGLIIIIVAAARADLPVVSHALQWPPFELAAWSGIAFASLLAFFAFIGFEDLANVVEEAKAPHRDLPLAMILTLVIATVLYVAVAAIAVTAVAPARLAASPAPLGIVFRELAGISPVAINAIAIVATLNTVLAQMTMAARVVYGMARSGELPRALGHVHGATGTPLGATAATVVAVLALAFTLPFEELAEATSIATLIVFALVNLALLRLKLTRHHPGHRIVSVPMWVPVAGLITCVAMIAGAFLR